MCDCFHIAFPNWHAASSGAGAGRRLRGPEPGTEDNSVCDEASQFTEEERPRPQGSSPVEEFPESDKYGDSDKECEAEHDLYQKSGKKAKKSGLGSIFDKRSTPKMSKLKEAPSPEAGVIVKTAKDGGAEGLVYSGGGKDGIFIKEVVPESPASKNLHLKEGDQVLSATVYFDDIPYEDAIQILEHAQAYKVKLCLKRKPDIAEAEGAIDSDTIPEDEVHQPEMRDSSKKRRGDARISWPKFPSLGRGKKSRFTRSHSSSEADEQRKLELSPTTSDTESPIKSQDTLKGKKKHKIKLPGLKRGRISSSEDTDAQNIQTEEIISPECLDSPSRETQDAEHEMKKGDKAKVEESETETHKTELVCLDSTLKTTDLTMAMVEEEIPSATASPDGKKKKKERSELKLKILGRDKKHKAKSSPKRLKTLGASLDKTDKENENTEAVPNVMDSEVPKMSSSKSSQMELRLPKVEIDISDVGIICKSNDKKGKSTEEKQAKTGFKLPTVGLSDVATEEIIKIDASVEGSKTKDKDDAFDRLLKRTELPKREDIVIPGMEDLSKITKEFKEPRAPLATLSDAELQAETVQMSIDVDSVKEAVSKLPGYKLPKVDTSGVPIPDEITVIDANAQRISVKTPTKGKHESKSVFTEISKTTIKLPNVKADVSGGEMISETIVGVKKLELDSKDVISTKAIISQTIEIEKVQKENITFSPSKEYDVKIKTPKVDFPDLSISKPDIKSSDLKMDLTKKKDDKVKGERTIFLSGNQIDVKVSDVKTSPIKAEFEIPSKHIDQMLKLEVSEKETPEKQEKGGKFKMSTVGISVPKVQGGKFPEVDVSGIVSVPEVEIEKPKLEFESQQIDTGKEIKFGIKLKSPEVSLTKKNYNVTLPEEKTEVDVPDVEITGDLEGGKFKLPKLGLKMPKMKAPELDMSVSNNVDVTLPDVKAKVEIPEVQRADMTLGAVEVSIPEQKVDVKAPSIEGDFESQGGKFKMPKLGVKLPKVKGPEFDIGLSKKDREGVLPKVEEPKTGVSSPEKKMEVKVEGEVDGQGGKFKMPKFGISMPKVKGPEIDFNLSKEEKDVKPAKVKVPKVDVKVDVPKAKIEMEKTGAEIKPFEAKLDIKRPEVKSLEANAEVEGQSGKFKIPRFTISIPTMKGQETESSVPKKEIDVALPEAKIEVERPKIDVEIKPLEMEVDTEGQGDKFKLPKFGIKMPKVKGPDIDISLPKKEVKSPEIRVDASLEKVDVKIPETRIEVEKPNIPDVNIKPPSGKIKIKAPDIDVSVTEDSSYKFKMPSLGFSGPKMKAQEVDLSLSKKDVDVTMADAKVEVVLPEISGKADVKAPDVEVSTRGSPLKFKMPTFKLPKFGGSIEEKDSEIKMEGADLTVSVPQLDVDLPDVSAEVHLPETEVKAPSGEVVIEQPSGVEIDAKFKKPRFSMPRFSFSKQSGSAPEVDINTPEVNIPLPAGKVEVKGEMEVKSPELDVSIDGQGGKFKLPKFGISMPKISAPEIDLSLSKRDGEAKVEAKALDIEINAPSIEAEIKSPEKKIEIKTKEGSPSKVKMPTFKLPKFGGSIPEANVTVSEPQLDIDLPDVKAEIHIPDAEVKVPSGEVVIEQPSLETDAKFKKSRFSLPRFSFSKQSGPAPEFDISAPEVNISQPEHKMEVKGEMDVKSPEVDIQVDGQGSKFKLPKFGISMPKISAPEIDLNISKRDGELTLPEAEIEFPDVEVKAPSIEAEIKAPEIKIETKTKEGSPSKLKMPTFKFPKFGASITEAEIKVEGPNVTQVDVDLPEVKAEIHLPEVEVKAPSVEVEIEQPSGLEMDAKFKKPKFSMPRFSFSKQSVPAPEVDISAPEVNIPQPEGKLEVGGEIDVKSPELEAHVDGQGSKFKLPKFGISMPKISAPEIDLSISKRDGELTLPEAEIEFPDVEVKAPSIEAEIKAPEIKIETKTKEGSPSKLKMPTFKFPKFGASIPEAEIKVEGPNVTQVDVDLPEVKAEINLPEVEVKAPSVEVEIEQPSGLEMDAKFKKPRFSMPRFSFSKQSGSAPEVDINTPEVNIPLPAGKVEVKGEMEVKSPELDVSIDGQGGKFKLPKFGISMPKISAPEIDLSISKRDGEAKVEAKALDIEINAPSIEAEIKSPEKKIEIKTKEGSPSKVKMPTFKLPKFGGSIPEANVTVSEPQLDIDLPDVKAEIHIPDAEVKVPSGEVVIEQPSLETDAKFKKSRFSLPRFSFSKQSGPAPEFDISAPEVNISQPEHKMEVKGEMDVKSPEVDIQVDGQGSKFKLPKFGISMPKISAPEIDLNISKRDGELTLPEAEIEFPDVEVKAPSIEAEIKAPEIKIETKTKEGSPSKLKMPTFKFPKFGASIPEAEIKVEGPNVTQVDVDLPEVKAEIHLPEVEVKAPSVEVEIEQPSGLEMDAKFKKPKFSMPRFSFSKQSVPAPEVDISAPEVNIPQPEGKLEVGGEIDVKSPELEAHVDGQGSKFKLPKFGISMPKISAPEIDLSISKRDGELTLPEAEIEFPDVEVKAPSIEAEIKAPEIKIETKTKEGSPSKLKMPTFKFPKFGASIPEAEIKVEGPNVTQVDVDLPEVKAEINLPEVEVKAPSIEVEIEQPSGLEMDAKFKKPRFSMPRFSFSKQSGSAPGVDISAPEVNIPQPEGKLEVGGEIDVKSPELEAHIDGQGSKFKLPKFGISMPKISAPEIDLSISKRDGELTLPEAKVEGKLPDVEVKAPSIEAEIKAPEIKIETKSKEGSPSKLKMPTFKFPKFGASIPEAEIKVEGPNVTQVDVDLPEVKAEIHLPEVEVKAPSVEVEIEQPSGLEMDAKFKKPKFSMPRFSFSKQSVPAPEVDISAPEVNIPQPEGKLEVGGEIDVKSPELEAHVDGQGSKFKLPKFGISMPKISAPEIDLNISKRDGELTLPEAEIEFPDVEVKAPSIEAEIKAPEIKIETKTKEGSPSKLKMPTFKFPKFGASIPEAEIKVEGPNVTKVDVDLPEVKAEIHLPEVEVKAPSVEVEIEQPSGLEMDAKFKKPKFSMPRFSFSKQSVPAPEVDISAPEVNIPQPEGKLEVGGEIDVKSPELETHIDGQGSKFKLPKFGISMPKISAPEIDLSISKRDGELTLPEAKVEFPDVEVKAPSIEAEIKAPEIKIETKSKEGSPSKLKMPTFKLPTFGASIPEAEIKVEGPNVTKVDVDLPEVKTKINLPEVEVKAPSVEVEIEQPSGLEMDAKFKKPRFSMPRFSFSKQSGSAPGVDISAPEVNIPQPEGKLEVGGEIDVKSPELEAHIDGQGSKFKLPKFGISMPKISAPEIDLSISKRDGELTLPEAKVEGKLPDVEVKAPSIEAEIKAPEIKVETKTKEGSPSKLKMPTFKLPKFGASIPEAEIKVDGIDVGQVDVDLPEVKAEVHLPEVEVKAPSVEVEIEQPSGVEIDAKFKKSRFSLPQFSFSKQSGPAPEVDISAPEVNIPQPEGKVKVKGEMDVKSPELDIQIDAQGSKFKLPKFGISMPKMSAPEIDLNLSKKDVEVTLPEAKLETKALGVEVKAPSIEAEMKAPELKVETKTKEGSPSKLKMPTFKLPKFGVSIPETEITVDRAMVDADIPDAKVEISLPETEVKAPSGEVVIEQPSGLEFDAKFKKPRFSLPKFSFSKQSVPAPEVDVSAPEANIPVEENVELKAEIDVKSPEFEAQVDGQGSKFKFPKFGISMPKSSAPEIDLSLSESKVEGQVPGIEQKGTSVDAEIKSPEIKVESKQTEGSPSKLKMPSFRMPKFGLTTSSVSADGVEIKTDIPEEVLIVQTDSSSVDIKVSELEVKRSKFKLPSLGFSTTGTDLSQEKKDMQVSDVEIKDTQGKVDIKVSGMEESSVEGSPSKFKMPSFKLPKFGATVQIDGEAPHVDTGINVDVNVSKKDVEGEKPEAKEEPKASWSLPKISFSKQSVAASETDVSVPESKKEVQSPDGKKSLVIAVEGEPTSEIDVKIKKPRFSLPKISFAKQPSIESEADARIPEVDVSSPDVTVDVKLSDVDQKIEGEVDAQGSKFKMPKFGISMPKVKGPEIDLSLSKKDADINSPDANVVSTLPEAEENELSSDAKQKGSSWSFPQFSFSKPAVNVTHDSNVDVKSHLKETTPELETKGSSVSAEDSPATETEMKAKFSLPRFSFSKSPAKEPMISESAVALEVSLSEGEVKIKEAKDETVEVNSPENYTKSKDTGGSPLKFKMPVFKMPKKGIAATMSEESSSKESKETEETIKISKEGGAVVITTECPAMEVKTDDSIKRPSLELKTDVKASTPDPETPQAETQSSPSKFKLPSFKMPRLSFSKSPQDENTQVDSKIDNDQLEGFSTEESKSPKKSLPSFGEILKNIDVEFDVPSSLEEKMESPSKDHEAQKQQETIKKETKQDATKSPERTGWFKFPTFGLSSPTDATKSSIKEDKKSPVDLTGDDELSPTCSIQSSEAFGDISSAMTSENVGFSLSSPTKVTVKYSDPDSALTGESHSNVVMSTTKTEVISVAPNLPEKVTILSSGLSSSSEDTVKLESGKIHIISSNIQAVPDSQQAKVLTSIHVQSAEGVPGYESWTVTGSQSSKSTFMESRVVRESSSREVVITKQITRVVKTTEPISDATASSIKQLKDSVHTDKMRFFDEAEK